MKTAMCVLCLGLVAAGVFRASGFDREFVRPEFPGVKSGKVCVVRRGAEWRPLKGFEGLRFTRADEPLRVPIFDIVPGTALDLSGAVPRSDIDRMGRIVANAHGELVYEKFPDVKVRLRGFNFTLGDVEDNFDKLTHAQLEAYAEQLRLRGMNVIRLHFQDRSYVGLHGGARYGQAARRTKAELGKLPQSLAELPVDAPRFQAAVLKFPDDRASLSALEVERASRPANVTVISLDAKAPVVSSAHLLVIVATRFAAEGSAWADGEWREFEIDTGDMQTLMRAGRFDFSVKNSLGRLPKAYALNLNGTRECEVPVSLERGRVVFALDTSKLVYGTPYFEVVF